MNLAVLEKKRHTPKPGDVFVMKPPDGRFLYGRVIATDLSPLSGVNEGVFIYVYRARSDVKTDVPALSPDELLTAPMFTNRLPWSKGYFQHVRNEPLGPRDRLPRHCFQNSGGHLFDEYGNPLDEPVEPVGQWGIHSFRTIDDEISKALGIPLAAD